MQTDHGGSLPQDSTSPRTITLCMIGAFFVAACSRPTTSTSFNDTFQTGTDRRIIGSFSARHTLTVTDTNGQPIANARLLIGASENNPFSGNLVTTNADGQALIPAAWVDAQPVTIEAPGHVRTTYFQRTPGALSLSVKKATSPQRLELKGKTTGFGPLPKDGYLDVGLVFPALTHAQASVLQVSGLISPEVDKISVIGQEIELPSNVTLPKQKETYILPITFDKPTYRLYLNAPRTYKIVSAHARFPFKSVVDDLRDGKSFFDVINKMQFRQVSLTDIPVLDPKNSADVTVDQIQLQPGIPVTAPDFDSRYMMLSAALSERDGLLFITDAKRFKAREALTLVSPANDSGRGLIMSVLMRPPSNTLSDLGAESEEMSGVKSPANQSQALEFLPIVAAPEYRGGTLVLQPPPPSATVTPALTYMALSKVEVIESGGANPDMKLEKKTTQWELYASEWVSSLALPEMPNAEEASTASYRWEVIFAGASANGGELPLGPDALEKVSHVTRSAVDL